MYKASEFTKPVYKAGETARVIGVTTETLRNYEDSGIIKFFRSSGGHRLIEREELLRFLDSKGLLLDDTKGIKQDVIYTRVSSHEQKTKGDFKILHELESAVGKDGVSRLFTEYMMTLVGKANKLDEIIAIIEGDGELEDVKEAL